MNDTAQYNNSLSALDPVLAKQWICRALDEDLGSGDVTTKAIVPEGIQARGVLTAKESLVLCGVQLAREVFLQRDPNCTFNPDSFQDGQLVAAGVSFFQVKGKCRALLEAERTALNILQQLSGIATQTRQYVEQAQPVVILDTRKTTPGMRLFEKYAVQCGGGSNHRMGLYDAVLIKDNHIQIAGSITSAVTRVREKFSGFIEVETTNQKEVDEALACGVDRIMLDNMTRDEIIQAVKQINGRTEIEVSGNVTLDRLNELKDTGIGFISVGALTHSAPAVDISMFIETE